MSANSVGKVSVSDVVCQREKELVCCGAMKSPRRSSSSCALRSTILGYAELNAAASLAYSV
jgi:hypothetical protein